jgi:hypothetical protein
MSKKNKVSFEEFAVNLSEESVNKVIKMEEKKGMFHIPIPERLTRAEWKAWCNGKIETTFSAYEVEIELGGEEGEELIEHLFPKKSYPELEAHSIQIYNDGAIYLDDDSDPFQYLTPAPTRCIQEEIEILKEDFNLCEECGSEKREWIIEGREICSGCLNKTLRQYKEKEETLPKYKKIEKLK